MSSSSSREEVKSKIRKEINPGEESGYTHNSGKPKKAPYGSSGSIQSPQYLTSCSKENMASLKCIEENYQNRSACQPFFDEYKECRKQENERRKEANAKAAAARGGGGWFW